MKSVLQFKIRRPRSLKSVVGEIYVPCQNANSNRSLLVFSHCATVFFQVLFFKCLIFLTEWTKKIRFVWQGIIKKNDHTNKYVDTSKLLSADGSSYQTQMPVTCKQYIINSIKYSHIPEILNTEELCWRVPVYELSMFTWEMPTHSCRHAINQLHKWLIITIKSIFCYMHHIFPVEMSVAKKSSSFFIRRGMFTNSPSVMAGDPSSKLSQVTL